METIIKDELFKNIESFVNELELSFDYIDKSVFENIHKYISEIKTDDNAFKSFSKYTFDHLKDFEKDISFALFSKQKVKSDRLNFLDQVHLLGDTQEKCLLHLSDFSKENKNTKKSLLKYLYNFYMTTFFIQLEDTTKLTDELHTFVNNIQEKLKESESVVVNVPSSSSSSSRPRHRRNAAIGGMPVGGNMGIPFLPGGLPAGLNLGGMENVMSSLLGNKDILNLATEISEQMKTERINPMSMLSGLMTGQIDPKLENLMGKIQQNVETKMQSGEINKEQFEEQAKNIIETVHNTDLNAMGIPGLNDAMEKLMKENKK
jgi:hypothetical protein